MVLTTHPVRSQEASDGIRTVKIEARPGLTYSPLRFHVKPGRKVRLVLKNTDQLRHNLLITKPGERLAVVNRAMDLGADAEAKNYVPDTDRVLWDIRIVNEGEKGTLTFTAPGQEGVYPYVCTLPGHGFVMYGAMYVQEKKDLPPLDEDPHVPQENTEDSSPVRLLDPLPDRARVYREFLPEASPAAVAVALPTGGRDVPYAYCFDAARCRVRYAWTGGFIDVPYRRGDRAEIKGSIYYRATAGFPLRFDDPEQKPSSTEFLGYSRADGVPTFRYRVDGHRVEHTVTLRPEGPGLVQQFQLHDVNQPVWYVTEEQQGARMASPAGSFENGTLRLSPEQARTFSVSVIPADHATSSAGGKK